ncbi:unnamed protein product [Protopolystoma xenopodis]|uniref:Uncharacterized protein n=1 Tax=Protopolystoma xenopodis TaxID=117903 RepID=A0A3S5AUW5_9PLAT|nr:unnamed protein product [Protopolystoma xenopodis]
MIPDPPLLILFQELPGRTDFIRIHGGEELAHLLGWQFVSRPPANRGLGISPHLVEANMLGWLYDRAGPI